MAQASHAVSFSANGVRKMIMIDLLESGRPSPGVLTWQDAMGENGLFAKDIIFKPVHQWK